MIIPESMALSIQDLREQKLCDLILPMGTKQRPHIIQRSHGAQKGSLFLNHGLEALIRRPISHHPNDLLVHFPEPNRGAHHLKDLVTLLELVGGGLLHFHVARLAHHRFEI